GVLGSSVCMDKAVANQLMEQNGIARCEWAFLSSFDMPNFDELEPIWAKKLGYPIFVKPANAGSSIGISKAKNKAELKTSIELALQHDSRVVLERFVIGQEIECAVMGNADPHSTLPGEILASAEFYDYDDKYIKGTSRVCIPANINAEKLAQTSEIAVKAYRALCCKGLARVDFFLEKDTGKILLNEINTLPGFTSISMYPKLMINDGLSYTQILDRLINLALYNTEENL
ncbi:MAG: D-alanine--D-alanine ligase, partial [Oscillospiraceae bacterium]